MRVFCVTAIPLRTSPGIVIDDRQNDGRTDEWVTGCTSNAIECAIVEKPLAALAASFDSGHAHGERLTL